MNLADPALLPATHWIAHPQLVGYGHTPFPPHKFTPPTLLVLPQAAYLTGGIYLKPSQPPALVQYLNVSGCSPACLPACPPVCSCDCCTLVHMSALPLPTKRDSTASHPPP